VNGAGGNIVKEGISSIEVPALVRDAGEAAVRAYREYLSDARLSASTRRVNGQHVRRFCRWAEDRPFTLQSVTAADCAAFATSLSPSFAQDVRSALRGLFRRLVGTGVLAANPLPRDRPGPRETICEITVASFGISEPSAGIRERETESAENARVIAYLKKRRQQLMGQKAYHERLREYYLAAEKDAEERYREAMLALEALTRQQEISDEV
jgi:Phage integrase, N-terminal SAM-like domain